MGFEIILFYFEDLMGFYLFALILILRVPFDFIYVVFWLIIFPYLCNLGSPN